MLLESAVGEIPRSAVLPIGRCAEENVTLSPISRGRSMLQASGGKMIDTTVGKSDSPPLRLAVLISGGGRTLLNLHDRIGAGMLPATIEVVVSSRGDVAGVPRSRDAGLRTIVVERGKLSPNAFQQAVTDAVLRDRQVDLVCMAGFLSLWRIPPEMQGRVMNIHPALLPDFGGPRMYGNRVHEAVLAAGRTESGCTVHFCDNEYDHGPIILQRKVPVLPGDTADMLAARVFEQECIAYPEAIRLFCERRITFRGKEVVIS